MKVFNIIGMLVVSLCILILTSCSKSPEIPEEYLQYFPPEVENKKILVDRDASSTYSLNTIYYELTAKYPSTEMVVYFYDKLLTSKGFVRSGVAIGLNSGQWQSFSDGMKDDKLLVQDQTGFGWINKETSRLAVLAVYYVSHTRDSQSDYEKKRFSGEWIPTTDIQSISFYISIVADQSFFKTLYPK